MNTYTQIARQISDKKMFERCSLTFSDFAYYYYTLPVRLYPLLISILPCTISDSNWLSVCQVIRAVLLTEIRIWKEEEEKEAVEGDLS